MNVSYSWALLVWCGVDWWLVHSHSLSDSKSKKIAEQPQDSRWTKTPRPQETAAAQFPSYTVDAQMLEYVRYVKL